MTHTFTLLISGVEKLTEPLPIVMAKAGCLDARIEMRENQIALCFRRKAATPEEASNAAIEALAQYQINVTEVRFEGNSTGGGSK